MILLPAVDLRSGRAVQLVGGELGSERVDLPDPLAVATRFVTQGFRALHVIDLDAAFGTGSNAGVIEELVHEVGVPVQVGGGVRSLEVATRYLGVGVKRVIVGTRAVEDPAWLTELATNWPGRVSVSLDTKDGEVLTRGWTAAAPGGLQGTLARLSGLPLASVIVTDVSREGRLAGVNGALYQGLVATTPHELYAAGGIKELADLRLLEDAGVAGAVLGMSLYEGTLDAEAAIKEFA